MELKIRKPYDKSEGVPFNCKGESLTKGSMQDECDINTILRKYEKTGLLTHVSKYKGSYEDLPEEFDYQMAQEVMIQAEEAFGSLTGKIRSKFENDPRKFLEFVQNPDNEKEMREMGLMDVKPQMDPEPVPTVEPGEGTPEGSPPTPDSP